MSKEQEELLDEVYLAYADSHWTPPSNPIGKLLSEQLGSVIPMEHSKESFINEIKTNSKFSKKWGLKIEERELNVDELNIVNLLKQTSTKLITLEYNGIKIESYE
jgi:hypothetical protein